jgi:hypothetical protein
LLFFSWRPWRSNENPEKFGNDLFGMRVKRRFGNVVAFFKSFRPPTTDYTDGTMKPE